MLQNLVRYSGTRCATASLVLGSSSSTAYASKRLYATRLNGDIIDLLKECEQKEMSSVTKNKYKLQTFRVAAAAIEKIDFRIQHGDELKSFKGFGRGIRTRINVLLGHATAPPLIEKTEESLKRTTAVRKLMTVPGLGMKSAQILYDAGCDTIEKLHLKKYKETLSPGARRGLKYIKHLEAPVPRENAEAIVEFCKNFVPMDKYEISIVGDYRRDASNISGAIEILVVDESATDSIPTPPHPSTLKPPGPQKPTRRKLPFSQGYVASEENAASVLLNKIIRPLGGLGLVSDTTSPGLNLWQGWMRVPKKGESWESRADRIDGIQKLDGDFHRVNITYVPKQSRRSALLVLTGDEDYYFDCTRKAVQAGLYLNEWGLWEWQPDSQSLSRFQTSDAPLEKTSLGAMWGSETEADNGRWVRLEANEEEEILDTIGGEYVPPSKRNFRFIMGKTRPKRGPVSIMNA